MAFKLKSGNTTPFKQMGGSPVKQGQADASLVAAAQRAAMANKPGDWTQHYDKANEGRIAASKAKAEMFGSVVEGAVKVGKKMKKDKKKKEKIETKEAKKEQKKTDSKIEKQNKADKKAAKLAKAPEGTVTTDDASYAPGHAPGGSSYY